MSKSFAVELQPSCNRMLLPTILEQSARNWPDRSAAWCDGVWKTYAELNRDADAVCAFLQELGVRPGDCVALFLENSFDYIAAHFGVLKAGAVDVSLNTELQGADISKLLNDCDARVLIAGRKFFRQWSRAIEGSPHLTHLVVDQKPAQPLPAGVQFHFLDEIRRRDARAKVPAPREVHDMASLVYTSGSTGKPKGVMLSHRNLASNTASIAQYLGLVEDDRVLVVLPFYYIYGRSILYSQFLTGGSVVIENRFAFPVVALNTMQEMEVTGFAGVPSTFSILLHKADLRSRKFPKLRFVTQAGGGMAPALQRDVMEVFQPARLFVMYGTTEAAPRLTYVEPEILPRKWGSIGRAIPGVEVIVADEHGNRLPAGTHGEIAARGPNIMLGYWKDPESTASVIRNGFYFTGDLGYEDEDGCLFVTGRARDIIKAGGNRVSGKEIEEVLSELPGVLEVAVIGVPDEILGEAIKALIVPSDDSLNEEAIRAHLRSRLPQFKQPKWIEFRESLVKNQAGKIMKAALKAEHLQPVA
jgi:long-chain acyl-CoA synthetase